MTKAAACPRVTIHETKFVKNRCTKRAEISKLRQDSGSTVGVHVSKPQHVAMVENETLGAEGLVLRKCLGHLPRGFCVRQLKRIGVKPLIPSEAEDLLRRLVSHHGLNPGRSLTDRA